MRRCILFLCALLLTRALSAQEILVPYADVWQYLDNGTNAGTAWRAPVFSDSGWKSGKGKFGYGQSGLATTVSYGPGSGQKYVTTYFRKTVTIEEPAIFNNLTGAVAYDDGVVVYVNGAEVYRNNMPSGTIAYNTLASSSSNTSKTFTIGKNAFVPGANVLAVEVHQSAASSSDLAFDMRLVGNRDGTAPTAVSCNRLIPATATTNGPSVTFRITFSEKVKGVDATDFTVAASSGAPGGAVGTVTPADAGGTAYDVAVNGISGTGAFRLNLKSSATGITDMVGNPLARGFTSGQTYTVDHTSPTLLGINRLTPTSTLTNAAAVTFRATFSEAMSGVDAADFMVIAEGTAGGTPEAVTPSGTAGTAFDVRVGQVSGAGTLRLALKEQGTGLTDAAGNTLGGSFPNGQTYTIDRTVPFVTGITRLSPQTEATLATAVTFRVVFSERVSSVSTSDFSVVTVSGTVTGTLASGSVVAAGTDGTTYDVRVTSVTGSGHLRTNLKATGTGIVDVAGNACGGYTEGQTYHFDRTAPGVLGIERQEPAAPATKAASVVYRIAFTEPVTGVDAADFLLTTVSGAATGVLLPDDLTPEGNGGNVFQMRVSSLSGNGILRLDLKSTGTGIADAAANAIGGGFSGGQTYQLDYVAPSVVSISRHATTGATVLTYRMTFSEAVSGLDAGDFTVIKTNTVEGNVTAVSGSGAVYDVTVQVTSGYGTMGIQLQESTGITDEAGNALAGTFAGGEHYNVLPALTFAGIASGNAHPSAARVGDEVTLSFTASTAINTPAVTIATHTVPAVASGPNSFTATYIMTADDTPGIIPFRIDFSSTDGTAGEPVAATTNGSRVTFDRARPGIAGIIRYAPATEKTSSSTVVFRAIFSEPVTGVDAGDFTLNGMPGGTLVSVRGAGAIYDVAVNASGKGTIGLDLNANGTGIADSAGNGIEGGYTGGETYQIKEMPDMRPGILYWENFEDGAAFESFSMHTATSYAFTIVNHPAYEGMKVGRWELRDTDPMANSGTRAEVHFSEEFRVGESWHAFAGYFPSAQYPPDSDEEVISQWHQGGQFGSPMLSLRTLAGRFILRKYERNGDDRTDYDLGPLPYDQWVEFVIHVKQHLTSGVVQLWINGTQVLNYSGNTMYNGPYGRWKIGVYKSDWNDKNTTDTKLRVWYIDDVRFGDQMATYETMRPEGNRASTAPASAPGAYSLSPNDRQLTGNQLRQPQVYPTLAKRGSVITISTNNQGAATMVVSDINARIVLTSRITGTATIETSNLSGGMYFVMLIQDGKVKKERFIITD